MARKIEKIEFHNSREKQHNSWFKQAAEALEVDLDDELLLGTTIITKPETNKSVVTHSIHLEMIKIQMTEYYIYVHRPSK